jgi:hypothetical protein
MNWRQMKKSASSSCVSQFFSRIFSLSFSPPPAKAGIEGRKTRRHKMQQVKRSMGLLLSKGWAKSPLAYYNEHSNETPRQSLNVFV